MREGEERKAREKDGEREREEKQGNVRKGQDPPDLDTPMI